MAQQDKPVTRRSVLAISARAAGVAAAAGLATAFSLRGAEEQLVWQIDPEKCIQCGKCATSCVLNPSAVKCVQNYQLCGYCKLCTGYFVAQPINLDEGAENQICPTGAIIRTHVEGDYYNYDIDASKCIGCAKCVKGCLLYGNGSFFLQIDRRLCVDCNRCSIAAVCPSQAISRIPLRQAYRLKMKMR